MTFPTCGHDPPKCDPSKPWSDQPADRCTRCFVFATQTPERRAANEKKYYRPAVCKFRGDTPVPPPSGVNRLSMKLWYECENPTQPLGPVVSPCAGCRSDCPGYAVVELGS